MKIQVGDIVYNLRDAGKSKRKYYRVTELRLWASGDDMVLAENVLDETETLAVPESMLCVVSKAATEAQNIMPYTREDAFARITTAKIGSLLPARISLPYLETLIESLDNWKAHVQAEYYSLKQRLAADEACVSCAFCDVMTEQVTAINLDWIPAYIDKNNVEVLEPVCPECRVKHLAYRCGDGVGEWVELTPVSRTEEAEKTEAENGPQI